MYDPVRKARDLMHLGKYSAAKKIYEDLSSRDPRNDRYHFQLGMCHLADQDMTLARKSFEDCLNINPSHIEALIELGDIHFKNGEDDLALELLNRGCQLDPGHARAHTYLARLYEHMENFPRAIEHYNRAVEGSSAGESPRHDLALAHSHNGDYLESYLILQELLDEADLGLLWSRINRTEADLKELNINATEDYISMLKNEMDEVEQLYFVKHQFSIHYTKSILDALERFLSLSEKEIQEVRNEIRMLSHLGLGFSGDTARFELHSIKGQYSGFQLGCYLYTAEQLTHSRPSMGASYHSAFIHALDFIQNHN